MLAFVPQKVIIYRLCSLLLPMLFISHSQAGLPVRNQQPLAIFAGIPELKSARTLDDEDQFIALNTTLSNQFIAETNETDPLFFDAESYVGDFFWHRGILDWELGLAVPYISYQKGFMDSFVMHWHDAFGLPDASRDKFPKNQVNVNYSGTSNLLLNRPVQGLGDIRLTLGKALQEETHYQHALYVSLKLPTGDSDKLLGSGGTDMGIFSTHAWQQGNWQEELQWGLLGMTTPDILPAQRRKLAGFMSAAMTFALSDSWSAILQYDAHTALYKDSGQSALGDGQIISAGSRWQFSGWACHLALLEDIKVDSAPDVGFQFGLEFGDMH